VENKRPLRKKLGLPEEGIILGTVASLHPVKNHRATIQALGILRRQGICPKAVFVGDGVARAELENLALMEGVEEQIVFAGRQRPAAPWFQALDFFVLPSFWEGQALALLQAISCELPVIASRIEGNTAVLGEHHAGYFDPADSRKLAELIEAASTSKISREAFIAKNAVVLACRDAACQLERVYRAVA
jgi:glycosyltransferase involved in cell wall biosynthesis